MQYPRLKNPETLAHSDNEVKLPEPPSAGEGRAADMDGAHRAHLMAAEAVDAAAVINPRLFLLDADGLSRTALGAFPAADTAIMTDDRTGCQEAVGKI